MRIVPPLRGVSCAAAAPAPAIATAAAGQPNQFAHEPSLLNILVGGHSIVPDAPVQEECRMTTLPNCLLIVTAEVDASVEADWNRWYDDVHLPDALACPGVRAGRRYAQFGRDLRKRPRPVKAHPDQALHHGLRARLARRRGNPGIHRHARLGPLCASCPLADAGRGGAQPGCGVRAPRPRGRPARRVGGVLGSRKRRPGLAADNTIRRQVVIGLEAGDRNLGAGAEIAVDGEGSEACLAKPLLEIDDRVARRAPMQDGQGGRGLGA